MIVVELVVLAVCGALVAVRPVTLQRSKVRSW